MRTLIFKNNEHNIYGKVNIYNNKKQLIVFVYDKHICKIPLNMLLTTETIKYIRIVCDLNIDSYISKIKRQKKVDAIYNKIEKEE